MRISRNINTKPNEIQSQNKPKTRLLIVLCYYVLNVPGTARYYTTNWYYKHIKRIN